ncbi:hypothetical protein SUGI_1160700 [Cryptomeria japonica]|nr:hypothetical protein SUGI_1160700 [Cryptomeria japonica]
MGNGEFYSSGRSSSGATVGDPRALGSGDSVWVPEQEEELESIIDLSAHAILAANALSPTFVDPTFPCSSTNS